MTANILIENVNIEITPESNIPQLLIQLREKGIYIQDGDIDDPDRSIISREIYKTIFSPFYDETKCSGDTLNTFNYTFGSDLFKLKKVIKDERIPKEAENRLLEAVNYFKNIYLTIGNFTVFYIGKITNNTKGMNCERASKLKDSWPLTLMYIQDYLEEYSRLQENPLKDTFEKNISTIEYFKRYKIKNGFEKYCDDHYFSPKYYENNIECSYLDKNFEVKLDLFGGLDFCKPLAKTANEMEQYIESASKKILARGEIMLREYNNKIKNTFQPCRKKSCKMRKGI